MAELPQIVDLRQSPTALRVQRGVLEADVIAAVDRFRPAELVPMISRDSVPA